MKLKTEDFHDAHEGISNNFYKSINENAKQSPFNEARKINFAK